MHDKPMAPNFFVEGKGPDGSAAVATRQARYDGAVGSRAMHSLQNYGREQPQYDRQAYTFTSTYQDGTFKLYVHHLTAPATDGGLPGYHMTQVDAWAMAGNRDGFVRGATAFRDARGLAKDYGDSFITDANARARRETATALLDKAQPDVDKESMDEFVDCPDSPPRTPGGATPRASDMDDCSQASALPELGDTATSFTSGFTAGFTADPDRPKRPRQPPSPNSKSTIQNPPSKSRQLRGTGKLSQMSPLLGLPPRDEADLSWVETYWHDGHVCFRAGKVEVKTDRKDWT